MEGITLGEKFSVIPKSGFWIVHQATKGIDPKTKELVDSVKETYHPNLLQCLNHILDRCSEGKDLKDIQDLRTELRSMFAEIKSLCKEGIK